MYQHQSTHYAMSVTDNLTHAGAHALADRIRAYWRKRGHEVTLYVVQQELPRGKLPLYDIRSRMVGGWPHGAEKQS